jgi:hypothetical protein
VERTIGQGSARADGRSQDKDRYSDEAGNHGSMAELSEEQDGHDQQNASEDPVLPGVAVWILTG